MPNSAWQRSNLSTRKVDNRRSEERVFHVRSVLHGNARVCGMGVRRGFVRRAASSLSARDVPIRYDLKTTPAP